MAQPPSTGGYSYEQVNNNGEVDGEEYGDGDGDELGNPLVLLMFDFFTEPKTSIIGYVWGVFTSFIVVLHILMVGLESCDGPNQYTGRLNRSSYSFLLNENGYWTVTLVCLLPLVIDTGGRVILLLFIFLFGENEKLKQKLLSDTFSLCLLIGDVVGLIPFFVNIVAVRTYHHVLTREQELILKLLELVLTVRILRITKDIPAIWAVRIALIRSSEHLVLPLFVFMLFNITAAVILFFAEPCYNTSSCPWQDLFQAGFFSVVTVTTGECDLCVLSIL